MLRAVFVAVLATACRDPQLAQLEEVRDEVCACKTAACADAALKRVPQKDVESNHRSQKLAKAMLECRAALNAQERPSTDPDAEVPAPSGSAGSGSGSVTSP